MNPYVLFFNQIDVSSLPDVGGKGANLGEMTQAGLPVPGGFCITTNAYQGFIETSTEMDRFFNDLDQIDPARLDRIKGLGERIRTHLRQLPVPDQIQAAILQAWAEQGRANFYAVRSSATAEDLPNASFAGQQDTYLNVKGEAELLRQVRNCWASLFTDRAIVYRAKSKFNHRQVQLSIVVQQMVIPETSGIMFTADPVNGKRTVVSIDAGFGLGEALVSGMVSADLYKVQDQSILSKQIAPKKIAIYALPEGGTITKELPLEQQARQALTDRQIIDLAELGRRIEKYYGVPQDIEFCLADGKFWIVQSRPITTLYPLPELPQRPLRLLFSFGHVQMMTEAMKPLGLSVLKTIFPASHFKEAGGRIYIDLTDILHNRIARLIVPKLLTNVDEAMSRALEAIVKRPEFRKDSQGANAAGFAVFRKTAAPLVGKALKNLRSGDPQLAKPEIETLIRERLAETQQALAGKFGAARVEAVRQQLATLVAAVFQIVPPYVLPGIMANAILRRIVVRKFGDAAELNKLNKSLPGNVTSEMGLKLGDLAELLRELPEVQEYLKTADNQTFYSGLAGVPGGAKFRDAFAEFIRQYGMRCPGEIDLTKPRWSEAPTLLISALFSHLRSLKPGEHRQRFAEGAKEAETASETILDAVQGNPFKTKIVQRLITVFRNLGGLREHHKYLLIAVMGECKKAVMAEAEELVKTGVLSEATDVYYLELDELLQILQNNFKEDVAALIARRKEEYQWFQGLKPPRIMTSEGESVVVPPNKGKLPEGTLIGSPVSAGIAEGIARVISRPENAVLNEGEILVAPHTDPGWTPLFQSAIAIITEVGGLMTHGAVIAREYGIPAVVGVDEATTLIHDGDKIRVDGVQGCIEILE